MLPVISLSVNHKIKWPSNPVRVNCYTYLHEIEAMPEPYYLRYLKATFGRIKFRVPTAIIIIRNKFSLGRLRHWIVLNWSSTEVGFLILLLGKFLHCNLYNMYTRISYYDFYNKMLGNSAIPKWKYTFSLATLLVEFENLSDTYVISYSPDKFS